MRTCLKRVAMAVALVCLVGTSTGCPLLAIYVSVPDAALESALREALGVRFWFLTTIQLSELRTLDARSLGIRNLEGLQYCENLIWLDLDTNQISDITPLGDLEKLTTLNLDSNQVFDIWPLAGLRNLDNLSLFNNQVADVQALVANATNGGLGPGDVVVLDSDTMSQRALTVDIPELERLGVVVSLVEAAGTDSGEEG